MAGVELAWDERGLVPAIVQDGQTGQVLMLAYMNRDALATTLRTGQAHYWSRSRRQLWRKGATSGHTQTVREIRYDCDADALLLRVDQIGAACHTGEQSCFHRALPLETAQPVPEAAQPPGATGGGEASAAPAAGAVGGDALAGPAAGSPVLERLFAVIQDRRAHPREGSYTCRLLAQGSDEVAKKVGEEAIEVVLAACGQGPRRLLSESADLVYHLMVLLAANDLTLDDLSRELEERMA